MIHLQEKEIVCPLCCQTRALHTYKTMCMRAGASLGWLCDLSLINILQISNMIIQSFAAIQPQLTTQSEKLGEPAPAKADKGTWIIACPYSTTQTQTLYFYNSGNDCRQYGISALLQMLLYLCTSGVILYVTPSHISWCNKSSSTKAKLVCLIRFQSVI